MTRSGFLFFNIFLVFVVYGLVYLTHPEGARYVAFTFSIPYIALMFLMAFLAMFRWYMTENPDVTREAITFFIAACVSSVLTYGVYLFLTHPHLALPHWK